MYAEQIGCHLVSRPEIKNQKEFVPEPKLSFCTNLTNVIPRIMFSNMLYHQGVDTAVLLYTNPRIS